MCGIVAIFSRRDPVSPAAVQRATQSLYHRGPDGQRHWISPDGRVALGDARLSIIDLTTGDQPIANEDEQVHIVVNGEFYGFEPIQRELERGVTACARAPTARSPFISTRTWAPNVCTACAVNSRLCSGMKLTARFLPLATGSGLSRCFMPSAAKHFISPRK